MAVADELNINELSMIINVTRICTECNQRKELSDFHVYKTLKNGNKLRRHICKKCRDSKYKKPQNYFNDIRNENKRKAISYLGGKCCVCGKEYPMVVYDFHHKDKNDKSFSLGKRWGNSWKVLRKELDKCKLVCANCHRVIEFGGN